MLSADEPRLGLLWSLDHLVLDYQVPSPSAGTTLSQSPRARAAQCHSCVHWRPGGCWTLPPAPGHARGSMHCLPREVVDTGQVCTLRDHCSWSVTHASQESSQGPQSP